MSNQFEFHSEGHERHTCRSRRQGDWLIFECPRCDYVRRWNTRTNEMKVLDEGDVNALHSGWHEPDGLPLAWLNLN